MKTFRALASAAALLATSLVPAHSATMTFDSLHLATIIEIQPEIGVYVEDGITATGYGQYYEGHFRSHNVPNTASMTDFTYPGPNYIEFTMSKPFNAVSIDIFPNTDALCSSWDFDHAECGIPFNNVEVTGGGASGGAYDTFYMGKEPWTYFFGPEFSNLDILIVAILYPGLDLGVCTDNPCTSMAIGNVTLSPIPLPAPLLLFLTGLGALALLGRRKAGANTSLH
jgi:hypothetical protein